MMKSYKLNNRVREDSNRKSSSTFRKLLQESKELMVKTSSAIGKVMVGAALAASLSGCGGLYVSWYENGDQKSGNNNNDNAPVQVDEPTQPQGWCDGEPYAVVRIGVDGDSRYYAVRDNGWISIKDVVVSVDIDGNTLKLSGDLNGTLGVGDSTEVVTSDSTDSTAVMELFGFGDTNLTNVGVVEVEVVSDGSMVRESNYIDWSGDSSLADLNVMGVYSTTDGKVAWINVEFSEEYSQLNIEGSMLVEDATSNARVDLVRVGTKFAEVELEVGSKSILLKPGESHLVNGYEISVSDVVYSKENSSVKVVVKDSNGNIVKERELLPSERMVIEDNLFGTYLPIRYISSRYACDGQNTSDSTGTTSDN